MGVALNDLALAAYGDGDLEQAGTLAQRSVDVLRDLGSAPTSAEALLTWGRIAAACADGAGAAVALSDDLSLVRGSGPQYLVPALLEAVATLASTSGREHASGAVRLLGASVGLRRAIGASLPLAFPGEREQPLAAVQAILEPDAVTTVWAAGQAMPLDQAVEDALERANLLAVYGSQLP